MTHIKFSAEHKPSEAKGSWPADVEELPDVQEEYRDWKLSSVIVDVTSLRIHWRS
jgi:hypothetical protein